MKKSTVLEVSVIRIVIVITQLLFLKIYTHYTSVHELGVFYFLLTISYSLNAFLLVPLDYFQQSQLYKLKSNRISLKSFYPINLGMLKLILSLYLVVSIICFFINPNFCYIILISTLYALSTYFVNLIRGIINNLENRRQAIYCMLIEYILKILFFLFFIQFLKPSSIIILASLLSASFVSLVILFLLLVTLPEYKVKEINVYTFKEVISFTYPMSIGAVINWVQLQSYTMILVPLGLVDVVGNYATVANVGSGGMNAYSTLFGQLFIPNIYKTNGVYIKKYLRNAVLSIGVVLLVSALFSAQIVTLLTRHSFSQYSLVIIFGILTEAGNFLIGALTIYLTIHNLTKVSIRMSILGLVSFVVSFFLLYLFHFISVYTVGIPMAFTQFVIVLGLVVVIYKNKKHVK